MTRPVCGTAAVPAPPSQLEQVAADLLLRTWRRMVIEMRAKARRARHAV